MILGFQYATQSNFQGKFPNQHTYTLNTLNPLLQLTFYEFQYYQGGYFKFASAGDDICDPNSAIEAGFDLNSQAVYCLTGYYSSTL